MPPDPRFLPPARLQRADDLLAPMPLASLRLDEGMLSAVRRLGLERIGELIAMPRAPLQRRFGETLLTRLDQALGRTAEPFEPIVPEESPSVLLRFLDLTGGEPHRLSPGRGPKYQGPKLRFGSPNGDEAGGPHPLI